MIWSQLTKTPDPVPWHLFSPITDKTTRYCRVMGGGVTIHWHLYTKILTKHSLISLSLSAIQPLRRPSLSSPISVATPLWSHPSLLVWRPNFQGSNSWPLIPGSHNYSHPVNHNHLNINYSTKTQDPSLTKDPWSLDPSKTIRVNWRGLGTKEESCNGIPWYTIGMEEMNEQHF